MSTPDLSQNKCADAFTPHLMLLQFATNSGKSAYGEKPQNLHLSVFRDRPVHASTPWWNHQIHTSAGTEARGLLTLVGRSRTSVGQELTWMPFWEVTTNRSREGRTQNAACNKQKEVLSICTILLLSPNFTGRKAFGCSFPGRFLQEAPRLHVRVWKSEQQLKLGSDLHDERRACGNIGLLGLQFSVGIVEAVPGGAHHVDHVGVHDREVREATRRDAQHAEVVVQRRSAVFDLDALLFVVHVATKASRGSRPQG